MPTAHIAALLRATPAARAVGVLLAMPHDRVAALAGELPAAELTRLLAAASPAQQAVVLAATPAPARDRVLGALPDPGAVAWALPDADLVRLLTELPPGSGAALAALLPAGWPDRLGPLLGPDADRLTVGAWVDQVTGTISLMVPLRRGPRLVADVLGSPVLVVLLPPAGPGPRSADADDVHAAVLDAGWVTVRGLIVLSPGPPTARAVEHAAELRSQGYPVEVQGWAGGRDDAALKRALVRLVGE